MENKKCANCIRELDVGIDTLRVDEGVIGTKDFVPLDIAKFFLPSIAVQISSMFIKESGK